MTIESAVYGTPSGQILDLPSLRRIADFASLHGHDHVVIRLDDMREILDELERLDELDQPQVVNHEEHSDGCKECEQATTDLEKAQTDLAKAEDLIVQLKAQMETARAALI